jgi:oligopeptide transport system substrate-binding protein
MNKPASRKKKRHSVRKNVAAAWLLLLIFTVSFGSCAENRGRDATLSFPIAQIPENLDPALAQSPAEKLVLNSCLTGLVERAADVNGALVDLAPGVAESWQISDNGKVYTFQLRKNARWYVAPKSALEKKALSGAFDTRITAYDFAFALNRVLSPQTGSPYADTLANVRHVEARSDFSLEITLEKADPSFLRVLAEPFAAPCSPDFFSGTQGRYGLSASTLLCNGPFYLAAWENTSVRLSRSDAYYDAAAIAPALLTFKYVASVAEQIALLGTDGGLSFVVAPADHPALVRVKNEKSFVRISSQNQFETLVFRCGGTSALPAKLRQALAAAIDVSALGLTKLNLLPTALRLGDANYRERAGDIPADSYDLTLAQTLFADAQWQEGKKIVFVCEPASQLLCKKILQHWQRAFFGKLKFDLRVLEEADFSDALAQRDFDVAFAALQAPDDQAALALAALTRRADKTNLSDFSLSVPQNADAAELKKIEKDLVRGGVYFPLAQKTSVILCAKGISGIRYAPNGGMFDFRAVLAR